METGRYPNIIYNDGGIVEPSASDIEMDLYGSLDPRSKEFADAIKLTAATLAHYRTKGRWAPAEHLMYIASILASEITMGDARIIVEVPPRHGKSELCSVHTPIWFHEHFPWANIMLTTYAADLAVGFGRRVRDAFLEDNGQFLKTVLRSDVQRTDNYMTTEGGTMTSVGIGGPITGKGAHLLLVDDYIKNWAEASSELVLQGIWDWFATTAYTRLEPGGSCVILATRWVIKDLIGMLKKNDKEHMWRIIRIPALAEANDVLNRIKGEALWPVRYSKEKLQQIRRVIGEYMFSAMYQQDPKDIADTKADVSMIKYVDEIVQPAIWRWVRSWDLASSDKKKSDWTVGSLVGTNGRPGASTASTIVADQVRDRLTPGKLEKEMRRVAEADGVGIPIVIEKEPGSSGEIAAEHIANNVLKGFNVTIVPSGGKNKWIRAQPYIAAVSNGRVWWMKAKWNEIHKEELKEFPNATHDDTVDSVAQGYNYLHQASPNEATWGRTPKDGAIRSAGNSLITGATWGRRKSGIWTPNPQQ